MHKEAVGVRLWLDDSRQAAQQDEVAGFGSGAALAKASEYGTPYQNSPTRVPENKLVSSWERVVARWRPIQRRLRRDSTAHCRRRREMAEARSASGSGSSLPVSGWVRYVLVQPKAGLPHAMEEHPAPAPPQRAPAARGSWRGGRRGAGTLRGSGTAPARSATVPPSARAAQTTCSAAAPAPPAAP